jgi:hypothetical protein
MKVMYEISQLLKIIEDLQKKYNNRKFTLDSRLVGG